MNKDSRAHILISALLAQLGLVLGVLLIVLSEYVLSESDVSWSFYEVISTTSIASFFGLLVSVPLTVIFGLPILFLLHSYSKLTLKNLLISSLIFPVVFSFVVFSSGEIQPGPIIVSLIPSTFGAYICWLYLENFSSLTKVKSPPTAGHS